MAYQSPLTLVYNSPAVYESDEQYMYSPDPIGIWGDQKQGPSIMDLIENSPDFTLFTGLIKKSGFEPMLRDPSRKVTMFAVPDSAFFKAPTSLLQELDGYDARSVVGFHILKVPMVQADMNLKRMYVETFHPTERILVDGRGMTVKIGFRHHAMTTAPTMMYHARILGADQLATNGIVHVLSIPLIPNALPVY